MPEINRSIDSTEVGSRLKAARLLAKVTQENAGKIAQISRPTIIAIENGYREVRPTEFMRLVKAYGQSVPEILQRKSLHINLIPRFRTASRVSRIEREKASSRLNILARAAFDLERLLGTDKPTFTIEKRPLTNGDARSQGIYAATDLRMRSGIGQSPIYNAKWLLEKEFGFRVYFDRLPGHVFSLYAYHDELGPCILLNSSNSKKTIAMTCALELGHFVATPRSTKISEYATGQGKRRDEIYASAFADEFTMPANELRSSMQFIRKSSGRFTSHDLMGLASRWNVTLETMCRRLEYLSLVREGTWNRIWNFDVFSDYLVEENAPIADDFSDYGSRVYILATQAYRQGLATEGALVNMLDIDHVSLRKIIQDYSSEDYDDLNTVETVGVE